MNASPQITSAEPRIRMPGLAERLAEEAQHPPAEDRAEHRPAKPAISPNEAISSRGRASQVRSGASQSLGEEEEPDRHQHERGDSEAVMATSISVRGPAFAAEPPALVARAHQPGRARRRGLAGPPRSSS